MKVFIHGAEGEVVEASRGIKMERPFTGTGSYLSAAELAGQPMSGPAWDNVLAEADAFVATQDEYDDQNTDDNTAALASAIVAARTGDTTYADKVSAAIDSIASNPYVKVGTSALGWARNFPAWIFSAELIDLPNAYPTIHNKWVNFLTGALREPYSGSGAANLLQLAEDRPNNIGAHATCACAAITSYTEDDARLSLIADLLYSLMEGGPDTYPTDESSVNLFTWDDDVSWHMAPDHPETYLGVNRPGAVRDGHDFDGIIPDDYRRNAPYDPANFPGPSLSDYPWESLGAYSVAIEILWRKGWSEAKSWGDDAMRRALARLDYLYTNHAAQGWTWAEGNDRWIPYFINYQYGTAFAEPADTGHGRPVAWADFTHDGRVA